MLGRIGGKAWIGTPNRLVLQTGPVECVQCLCRESQAVIVEGEAGVAPIAGDVDVLDFVVDGLAVEGQMALNPEFSNRCC